MTAHRVTHVPGFPVIHPRFLNASLRWFLVLVEGDRLPKGLDKLDWQTRAVENARDDGLRHGQLELPVVVLLEQLARRPLVKSVDELGELPATDMTCSPLLKRVRGESERDAAPPHEQ